MSPILTLGPLTVHHNGLRLGSFEVSLWREPQHPRRLFAIERDELPGTVHLDLPRWTITFENHRTLAAHFAARRREVGA